MELYQTYYINAESESLGYNQILEKATKCVQSFEGQSKSFVFKKMDERNGLEKWVTDGYVLLIINLGENHFKCGMRKDGIK